MQVPDPTSEVVWGVKLGTVVAGVVGGIVRALLSPYRTWRDVARSCVGVIVGLVVAVVATPLVAAIIDRMGYDYLPDASVDAAIGSLLGMLGLTICEAALRWAHIWKHQDPPSLSRP